MGVGVCEEEPVGVLVAVFEVVAVGVGVLDDVLEEVCEEVPV